MDINTHVPATNEAVFMQALNRSLDALMQAVMFIALQNGSMIQLSPDVGEYLFKSAPLPEIPIVQEETKVSSEGVTYISRRTYENAYSRIVVYFNEYGVEVKRDNKNL
jgi:hypothetical protein